MAEFSYPWGVDATDAAVADSRLYQAGWRELVGGNLPDCVVFDRSNASPTSAPLYVSAPGTGTVISIAVGSAVVQGALYDLTAIKTIDVATIGTQPSAGQSRTDRVVLRYSPSASPASTRLSVQLLAGTAATTGSQVAPALTQSPTGTWEVEIARLTRASGANVLQANITNNQPKPIVPVRSALAPANPFVGQQWFDTNDAGYVWTGTAWKYNSGGLHPVCQIVQNTAQTAFTTGTFTSITFDGETLDSNNQHSTASNTSRVVIGTTLGWYRCSGAVSWPGMASGTRVGCQLALNGAAINASQQFLACTTSTPLSALLVPFYVQATAATDYVELQGWQSSGGNLAPIVSGANRPYFTVEYVSP